MASISAKGSRGHHKFTLTVVEDSTSISENNSYVSFSFVLSPVVTGYNWSGSSTTKFKYTINIGGNIYTGNIPKYDGKSTVTVKSVSSIPIPHNSDGTGSLSFSFDFVDGTSNSYTPGNASASGSMVLTTIPRDFSRQPYIELISKTETSLTFKWSTSETCNWVRYHLDNSTSWVDVFSGSATSGTFTVSGLAAGSTHYVYAECRRADSGRWLNSNNPQNQTYYYPYVLKVSDFTMGDSVKVDIYNPLGNNVMVTMATSDTVLKYGYTTGTSITFSDIDVSGIYNAATYENPYVNVSVFTGTDTTIKQVKAKAILPMITSNDWNRPTPTSDIAKNTNLSGSFYNGVIGENENTISIQYRYKETDLPDTSYSEWETISNAVIESNTFVVPKETLEIPISYTKRAIVQIKLNDISKEAIFDGVITKGNPVYYVADDEFGINGDLKVKGDLLVNNKNILDLIYPVGTIYRSVNITSPSSLFGGIWERIKGFYLYCEDSDTNAGGTFGSFYTENTVLTAAQSGLPSHSHQIKGYHNVSAGSGRIVASFDNNVDDGGGAWVYNTGGWNASQGHNHLYYPPSYTWRRIG